MNGLSRPWQVSILGSAQAPLPGSSRQMASRALLAGVGLALRDSV